jgi:hypothetical protein
VFLLLVRIELTSFSSIEAPSIYHLRRIVSRIVTSPELTSPEVASPEVNGSYITGSDVTGTGSEPKQ